MYISIKEYCTNIIYKYNVLNLRSTSDQLYNILQHNINLIYKYSNVQLDRSTSRVLGHAHFPWQLSSLVCLLGMSGTTGTHPLIGYMRQELLLRMREAIPGNLDSSACAETHLVTRQRRGVASLGTFWSKQDQNAIGITLWKMTIRIGTMIIRNSNQHI